MKQVYFSGIFVSWNHYHVVLHVDKARAAGWSDLEVAERWLQLYKAPVLVERWLAEPAALGKPELDIVAEIIAQWRERLYDLSWFMGGVNETIARMANAEDKVKGRFYRTHPCVLPFGSPFGCSKAFPMFLWEGRFRGTNETYMDAPPVSRH